LRHRATRHTAGALMAFMKRPPWTVDGGSSILCASCAASGAPLDGTEDGRAHSFCAASDRLRPHGSALRARSRERHSARPAPSWHGPAISRRRARRRLPASLSPLETPRCRHMRFPPWREREDMPERGTERMPMRNIDCGRGCRLQQLWRRDAGKRRERSEAERVRAHRARRPARRPACLRIAALQSQARNRKEAGPMAPHVDPHIRAPPLSSLSCCR